MKASIFLFLLLTLAFFSSCKKKVEEGPLNDGFVEFKIDGKKYRYDSSSLSASVGTFNFLSNTNDYSHFIASFAPRKVAISPVLTLTITNSIPLAVGKYNLDQNSDMWMQAMSYSDDSQVRFVSDLYSGPGSLEITKIERHHNGLVEGKFSFTSIVLDPGAGTASPGHVLTEGSFSVRVDIAD